MYGRPAFGRHWTSADDERLRGLAREQRSDQQIALEIGRSAQAVNERIQYLRLAGRG